jgi:hypothetical protein
MLGPVDPRHDRTPTEVLHFSEDPGIRRFVPHVPPTNPDMPPLVWAIDEVHAPLYWFPRDCPRVTFWSDDGSPPELLGPTAATRVHAVEGAWLPTIQRCRLVVYRLPAATFRAWPDADGHWVSEHELDAPPPEVVGDLLQRHAAAGIELRVVPDLRPLVDAVVPSGYRFSMCRLRYAGQGPPAAVS